MADETIIIQYVVDANKAIENAQRMREVINQSKADIRKLADDAKLSFKDVARAMSESFKSLKFGDDTAALANFLRIKPDDIQNAKAFGQARTEAITLVRQALSELAEDERNANQEAIRYSRERVAEESKNAQEAAQIVKEQNDKKAAAMREYITKTSQGWRTLSDDAKAYGRQIEEIKQKLYQFQQPMGSDMQGAGQQLIARGYNADDVTQALKEIQREEKATADLQKKNLAELTRAQQEYEKVSLQGYGRLSPAAQQYGDAVQHIKNTILAQAQTGGQTYQQIAQQMSQAGVGANVLKTALEEIKREETAVAEAAKAAKNAEISAMREYESKTKQGYTVMSQAAQQYGQAVQQIKQQIVSQSQASGQTYTQVGQQMVNAGASINQVNSALKQLNQTSNQTQSAFQSLGNVITNVFIIGLGVNVFNIMRQLVAFFQRASAAGFELSKAFFQLEVGIRALRRAGVDIATKEMLDNLDQLSAKFGVFSKRELVQGSAALVNLVRDMGFTKNQIFELQDAIATLAVVNGRSMEEVQRTVALALASGYTEGLQRLGVSINRVNIAARASAMGFAEGYMNLTEYERAAATLSLVLEKTALYQDDLIEYQKTEAGQLDTLIAKQKDQTALMGDQLLPLTIEYNKALTDLLSLLTDVLSTMNPFITAFVMISEEVEKFQMFTFLDDWGKFGEVLKLVLNYVKLIFQPWNLLVLAVSKMSEAAKGAVEGLRYIENLKILPWATNAQKVVGKLADSLERLFRIKPDKIFADEVPVGTPNLNPDSMEESGKKMEDYITGLYEDIQKETRNFNNRMDELWRDLSRDLEKIDRDFTRDMLALWRDYQRDKAKIIEDGNREADKENQDYIRDQDKVERDYQNKVADENRDYQNDLAEAALDFQRKQEEATRKYKLKQEEAERKYREDQIQAEIDYQEQLRKLREGFLFDLEDALRERDARQVLNLTRRYNMEKNDAAIAFQLEQEERARRYAAENEERARQFALENEERIRQFQEEQAEREREHHIRLADMAREKDERLAEMALEHQQRLEQIKADTAAELEERRIQYEQEKEDRKRKAEEDKAERQIRYQEQLEELRISNQQRLQEIVAALSAEEGMTAQMLNSIGQQYRRMYGPNGVIEGYVRYYIGMLTQLATVQAQIQARLSNPMQVKPNPNMPSVGRQAKGGTYYADTPTTAVFGEAGPEIAQFTPLNGSRQPKTTTVGGRDEPVNGKISLLVSLDRDLIAEIEENTLNRAGDILMEVQRSAR